MVYAYTNPAAADLVDTAEEWPGVSSFEAAMTKGTLTATRPKFFFRADGHCPEEVTVTIVRPRGSASQTQVEWNKLLTDRVRSVEAEHRERRRMAGKTVLGRDEILRQKPSDSPKSLAPHFRNSPRIAATALKSDSQFAAAQSTGLSPPQWDSFPVCPLRHSVAPADFSHYPRSGI